jgi:hypothetical protein
MTCENDSTGIYNSSSYRNLPVTVTSEEKSIEKACENENGILISKSK